MVWAGEEVRELKSKAGGTTAGRGKRLQQRCGRGVMGRRTRQY